MEKKQKTTKPNREAEIAKIKVIIEHCEEMDRILPKAHTGKVQYYELWLNATMALRELENEQ